MEALVAQATLPGDFVKGGIPLERYYEAMNAWRIRAELSTTPPETAFVLFMKMVSLYTEHLPRHPEYSRQRVRR
jgi:hypothetical protein